MASSNRDYERPFGKGKAFLTSGLGAALLGNWQVNALVIARPGTPFTPTIKFDNANANGGTQRPNLIGDPNSGTKTLAEFFNTGAYAVAAPYTFGNEGRNSLRGPRYTNLDISLFRSFTVSRAETAAQSGGLQFPQSSSVRQPGWHLTKPGLRSD